MLLLGLFILAVFYTLYFARQVILPVVIGVLLNFLFSPLVRWLNERLRVPYMVSAALILTLLVGTLSLTIYRLATPAAAWIAKGPASWRKVEQKLDALRRPVEEVSRTAEQVERMTSLDGDQRNTVEVKTGGFRDAVFGSTQSFITGVVLVFTLLFFLLADGDVFTAKLVKVLPRVRDKRVAMTIALETEKSVSIYLGATTVINIGLGILTGAAMWLIGLPNPVLWGVVGGLLNFIPYIGGFVAVIVLTLAGLVTFESTGKAFLPGGIYLFLTNLESFVTPYILGNRLTLNPVVIFISVLFWGWLWGIPGALLAVPIMATFKIICDHVQSLAAVGEFLGK